MIIRNWFRALARKCTKSTRAHHVLGSPRGNRRVNPQMEVLEEHLAPAAVTAAYDAATATLTFLRTGGTTPESVTLLSDAPGNQVKFTATDLLDPTIADPTDFQSDGGGVFETKAPASVNTVTVTLGTGDSSLNIMSGWGFSIGVTYTGAANADTLNVAAVAPQTVVATGPGTSGGFNGFDSNIAFSALNQVIFGGNAGDTLDVPMTTPSLKNFTYAVTGPGAGSITDATDSSTLGFSGLDNSASPVNLQVTNGAGTPELGALTVDLTSSGLSSHGTFVSGADASAGGNMYIAFDQSTAPQLSTTSPMVNLTVLGDNTANDTINVGTQKSTAAALVGGGSGYAAGDVLVVNAGKGSAAAQIIVDTVDGTGAILTAHVDPANPGSYAIFPSGTESVSDISGPGNGATFTLTGAFAPMSTPALTIDGQGGAANVIHIDSSLALGNGGNSGPLGLTAQAIHLDAASINTGGGIVVGNATFQGPVVLGSDVTITADNIHFASTVDSDTAGTPRNLVLTPSRNINADAALGSTFALGSLTISNAVFATFSSIATTTTAGSTGNLTQPAGSGTTTLGGGTIAGLVNISVNAIALVSAPLKVTGSVTLQASFGAITEAAGATIATPGTLTTVSGAGTTLGNINQVGTFNATDNSSTGIDLVDAVNPLVISGISETGSGNVSVTNSGGLVVAAPVHAAGAVTLTASGTINVNAAITGSTATVLGGSGADTINISVTGTTPLAVNGEGGGDVIQVTLGALQGAVNVAETGSGSNSLTVNGTAAASILVVTPSQLSATGSQLVNYSGIEALLVSGGSGGNTFNVQGTASGVTTTLNTGTGTNTVDISSTNHTLDTLKGLLTVNTQGSTSLVADESGASTADTDALSDSAIVSTGVGFTIDLQTSGSSSFSSVQFLSGAGTDTVSVTASGTVPFTLNGGPPSTLPGDTLIVEAGGLAVAMEAIPSPAILTVTSKQPVLFSNFESLQLNDAAAAGTFPAPNTTDRATALAGLDAQHRFVQALYLAVLDRPGSPSELQPWVNVLNAPGGSQTAVVAGIADSFEALDDVVEGWYVTFLGRAAQNGEELGWVSLLTHETEEQVLTAILSDPGHEFYNRAQTLVASGTPDERYVQAQYNLVLNRRADPNETAGWVSQIPQMGLAGVAFGVLQSQEYRLDIVTLDYIALVHRLPSQPELFALGFSQMDTATLRKDIESSEEFFTHG